MGNLNCTRLSKIKKKKKKKHEKYGSNGNVESKKKVNSSSDIDDNEIETLPSSSEKRVEIPSESVEPINVSESVSVWVCPNRQLVQLKRIDLGLLPCLHVLIEQIHNYFKEITEESTLAILYGDGTWAEICASSVDIALIDIGIKHNSIISIENKEKVPATLPLDGITTETSSNLIEKPYLLVKHISSNRDVQIEFDENDTISVLKEKILSQFQSDFDIEHLQFHIDSKLIDSSYDNHTLSSLNISSTSIVTINESKKIKKIIKGDGHYGLRNLGNTCYMNSALQCLSNVELLTDYFLTNENVQGDVTRAYYNFIQDVWKRNRSYNPKSIKNKLSYYAPQFDNYDQQDAHEFMIFLLNQLHDELKEEEQTASIISELFRCQLDGITTCLTCKKVRTTSNFSNFIPLSLDNDKKRRIFKIIFEFVQPVDLSVELNANGCIEDLVVTFINELQKNNKHSTDGLFERLKVISTVTNEELSFDTSLNNVLDPELKFSVDEQILRKPKIGAKYKKNHVELIDCLHEFIAVETPSNLWFCKMECAKPVHVAKQMLLSVLPPVLIIQLKRFTENRGYMRKIDTFVNFPIDKLNLSKFMVNQQENALYDLIAVVNHMGNVNQGHYTAYARQLTNASKQWFCFNDDQVTPIDDSDVVSSSAYILTYVKQQ